MTSPKIDGPQLDFFSQDDSAPRAPAARPAPPPPQPLFKAPPAPPRITLPSPPRTPDDPPLRRIVLGHYAVDYELKRSARRSIGFMIDDDGLHVTAPRRATLPDIDNAIRAKQRWILTKLHERGERRAKRDERAPVTREDGARLPYRAARSCCACNRPRAATAYSIPRHANCGWA
ncbi:hypothetical protein [Massilia sp. Dwa41.01b]|uniref:hypothetical protein n=1 Tax=Massilia sp. Dwa41.01b TaxID=2709302 RepID=UPI002805E041|nr:hypothetical protein [Massilia sp. Dwa41.01b]